MQISRKLCNKLITEEKRVTLCVAFTHGNAVSQKASFRFCSEDISFFTIALNELPNITLQNTRELANCSKKGNVELCVMKSHIRKQNLSKLLSSCYLRIFPFHDGPLSAPKSHFADSTKRVLANYFLRSKL